MPDTLRVAIVDDEPLARQHIADRLAHEDAIEIVGEADNGQAAVELIRSARPDVVFLDVQMPGIDGLAVVDAIGAENMPVTVFTTAFDQYALQAFDRAAVDYLLKPFDDDRFSQAVRRARKAVERQETGVLRKYADRITVESRGQIRVVPVHKIDYITASGPYAELHVGDRAYAVRERMQSLEESLDPEVFLRVHRSAIVRLDRIDAMLRNPGGDYAVRLKDGTRLNVSRGRWEELVRRQKAEGRG